MSLAQRTPPPHIYPMKRFGLFLTIGALIASMLLPFAASAQEPELIFNKSTVWRMLTPDDKLATYAIDDPIVEGVACHFTVPERAALRAGWGWRRK